MTNATPPGWYPDNVDPSRVRWWDGSGWTDQTQPAQQHSAPPPPAYPSAGDQARGYPGAQLPGRPAAARADEAGTRPAHDVPVAQRRHDDPYAQQAKPAQSGPPAYGQRTETPQQHDPYASQARQPQAPPPDSFPGESRVRRFNDSIAQGYGDQTYGGHTSGPTDGRPAPCGRNVFTEPVLVVSQKRKIIEVTNEYAVYAQDGSQLGAVVEVGQSGMKKAVRLLTSYDQFLTHRLEVRDNDGQVLLRLTRPAKVFKSTILVEAPDGQEIGRLVQQNMFGKIRFGLLAGGAEVGLLNAENWRAWNFALLDSSGAEVARVTKTWEGLLTTMFTTADNYVVHIHQDLPDPLRSLCVAAALTVDTALKQDDR